MNRRRWLPGLLCAAFFFGGCTYAPADAYTDFLADADVEMRFSICIDDIEKGRDSFYTVGELRALERDLEGGYAVEDEAAREATRLYQQAARELRAYLESEERREEDLDAAKASLAAAARKEDEVQSA